MDSELLLQAQRLGVARGGRHVLREIELSARAGEIIAVLGPNGAGKSSLLRALVGLAPYTGQITLGQHEVAALSAQQRATRVAFVPQQSALRAALPVHEVVAQGRYAHRSGLGPNARDRAAVEAALQVTGSAALASRPFTQLSLGEQRRVLLARALSSEARVLCLDEPSAAFDVAHALQLYALLRELAHKGHAIVIVLHQLDDALHHADRALLLADGRCACAGPVAEVICEDSVRRVYGVELLRGAGLGFRLPAEGA